MTRGGLIAQSSVMRELLRQVARFAAADANVLITGETGVGKDVLALALHMAGPRRPHPFVKIDCPSLPAGLVESELFGHERGAFTDAAVARAGRFEQADQGTVYLDNVDELPIDVQGTLLRAVEDKRIERLGGTAPVALTARVVASAGPDLEDGVRRGAFRDDLYHRLRVLPLRIPPLRERHADIAPLAHRFLRDAARRHGRTDLRLSAPAIAALERYEWPGNVRQLRHIIERAVLAAVPGGVTIDLGDLSTEILETPGALFGQARGDRKHPTLEEVERRYIEFVLREARGNQTRAAAILGISRKALWERRRRLGLE